MKQTILNAGMILCGEWLTPLENGSFIIEDGVIRGILPRKAREALYLEDTKEISLPHMTLMSGMIKCHNHLCIDAALPGHLELPAWSNECQLTLLALKGLKEDLMSGIITARCMGDKFYIDVTLKKLIEDKRVDGPRLLAVDIGMKGSHGVGHIGVSHCRAGEIRHTCRENLKEGVDLLELFIAPGVPDPVSAFVPNLLSLKEVSAAVSEGARLDILTAAHCIGDQDLKDCIDSGADVIERMYMASEQDVRRLAAPRCVVDLTSGIFLGPSREEFLSPVNALRARLDRSRVCENVAHIAKACLPFVLGADAYHGFLYREVGYAVELGADPVTAIQGVTPHAARACRLGDRVGKLENGAEADIIAVEGDPSEDVSRPSQVGLVMRGGMVYRQPQRRLGYIECIDCSLGCTVLNVQY